MPKVGYKLTKKHKKNISKGLMGENNPNWRKNFSKETREKMRLAKTGRKLSRETRIKMSKSRKCSKNNLWKGGITPKNRKIRQGIEFRLWREAVFARDNWTCQKCGKRGGELHPHHIYNFADYHEFRFAIDNGVTLCKKCHKEFHKKYGTKNNTREQLEKFLNNK